MISIDKLIQQLQQCKDNSVTLPKMNDSLFTQKTAFEIRKNELDLLDTNFKDLNEANYTIECNIVNDNLFSNNERIKVNNEKVNNVVIFRDTKEVYYYQVDYKTKKKYGENKIKISSDLYKYIVKLYNYYNNKLKIKDKYFLYQKDNITPFNTNNLSKFYLRNQKK